MEVAIFQVFLLHQELVPLVACLLDLQLGWESIYLRTGINLLCNAPSNNKNNNEGMVLNKV